MKLVKQQWLALISIPMLAAAIIAGCSRPLVVPVQPGYLYTRTATSTSTVPAAATLTSTPTQVTVSMSQPLVPASTSQNQGATGIPVLRLSANNPSGTVSTLTTLTLTGASSGTGNDGPTGITAVKLYVDTNNNGVVDGGETLLGTSTYSGDGGTVTFTFSNSIPPSSTVNYLVVYDFAASAPAGTYIPTLASVSSLAGTDSFSQPLLFTIPGSSLTGATTTILPPSANTSTSTRTSTASLTSTATSTRTFTSTSTRTNTLTLTPTGASTATSTFTSTATRTSTATLTSTLTSTRTATSTFTSTNTSGGPTSTFTSTPTVDPKTIDNFEDADGQLILSDGRDGYWNTNAGSGSSIVPPSFSGVTPAGPGNGGSNYAVNVTGVAATGGYAELNGAFHADGSTPYNASAYTGISFWAKANTSGGYVTSYRLAVKDTVTTATYDYNGANLSLTSSWTQYTVYFSSMATAGWGSPGHALDAANVITLFVQPQGIGNFDFTVDDFQFITTTPPTPTPTPSNDQIDDFEDNNGQILTLGGRSGYWYTSAGGGSSIAPSSWVDFAPGVPQSPSYDSRVTGNNAGGGYANWGSSFVNGGAPYNISGYTGISFWAKADTSGGFVTGLRFTITDTTTAATYDTNGTDFVITSGWVQYTATFASMATAGWGSPGHILDTVNATAFGFGPNATGNFDFQVDDIRFVTGAPANTPTNTSTNVFTDTPTDTPTATNTAGGFTDTPTSTPTTDPKIIDNFEDANGQVILSDGRDGYWNTNAGSPSSIVPASWTGITPTGPGNGGSNYAVNITGVAGAGGYAELNAAFHADGATPYNASAYTGISFWAKANTSGGYVTSYRLAIKDPVTGASYDYNGANLSLTSSWTQYTVYFSSMATAGWGSPGHVLDTANVITLFVQPQGTGNFDFTVDDIQFINSTPPTPTPTPSNDQIDDFEDGNGQLLTLGGRNGYWYTSAGSGSTIAPSSWVDFAPGVTQSPSYGSRVSGNNAPGGYANWGANFVSGPAPYNVSGYSGISFWAKADTSGGFVTSLRLSVSDTVTNVTSDTNGFNFSTSSTWTQYTATFASMTTAGWGSPGHVLDTLNAIAIGFGPNGNGSFDFQVDDIRFTP